MHFQKSAKIVFFTIFCPFFLFSQENKIDEKILSDDRLKLFDYSKKQNEESSSKLRKDWINPITFSYEKSKSDTNDTLKSAINISQPIFKSGGIYSAIKYANATFDYTKYDIELQRKELIKEATTMLFNLHILDLNIKKNELLLKNAQIDVFTKKEQVLNGFIDTSTLDNAILDANVIKNNLADLYYEKDELVNNFENIASGEYTSFELPFLNLVDEQSFLKRNLELSKAKANVTKNDYFSDMTVAKYLPTVSFEANHTQYHQDKKEKLSNENIYSYGLSVSMPFDIRALNDIEVEKINYLSSKLNLKNSELEEKNYYKTKLSKLKMLENKKKIAQDDYKLYDSLLQVIVEEKNAELKTQSDVDILQNSQKIKSIELKIYELEKQIELLNLYSKIS
ncbi:hypothetical protein CRV08_15145 [Halarcobacter ebronensis]|uniref:Transporter n=1 Tax=Halarcobacter ebronensis TaxID=1462615 RepID=A0A4Q0Y9N6_9BACT|nr:TolC family protein [Halarcobacter ebronensis]RXJ65451.1 hypothetical protein CRV08_15145 [Halarcobacter ebronensis]